MRNRNSKKDQGQPYRDERGDEEIEVRYWSSILKTADNSGLTLKEFIALLDYMAPATPLLILDALDGYEIVMQARQSCGPDEGYSE